MAAINPGALPQGQPGAAASIGVKGQKVSDGGKGGGGLYTTLGVFLLDRLCSQAAEGGTGGGIRKYAIFHQNSFKCSSKTSG